MSTYTIKSGDTIFDAAYNATGSLAGVDPLIELNTPKTAPMLSISQLRQGFKTDDGGYAAENRAILGGTIEFYFTSPDYPLSVDNVLLSDNTQNKSSAIIWIMAGSRLVVTVTSVDIANIPLVPSSTHHVIVCQTNNTAWCYIDGIKYPTVRIEPNTNANGLSLGVFPDNDTLKATIYFARTFTGTITDETAIRLWNSGTPYVSHLDWPDIIAEYIPENIFPYGWLDSGGEEHDRLLPVGSPSSVIGINNLPPTNGMETYTPVLAIDQILDTTDIPIYNLEAVDGNSFNSTYLNTEIVRSEVRDLEVILGREMIAEWLTFTDEDGNPILTEDNKQIELLTWRK